MTRRKRSGRKVKRRLTGKAQFALQMSQANIDPVLPYYIRPWMLFAAHTQGTGKWESGTCFSRRSIGTASLFLATSFATFGLLPTAPAATASFSILRHASTLWPYAYIQELFALSCNLQDRIQVLCRLVTHQSGRHYGWVYTGSHNFSSVLCFNATASCDIMK